MIMRVFLMLLIFAIGFSGYSAAAHAFGSDSCHSAMKAELAKFDMDVSECSGYQADQDQQKDADQNKSSKAQCMGCAHCCASHAMGLSNYDLGLPQLRASGLSPFLEASHNSDFIASMLRPPKSLV